MSGDHQWQLLALSTLWHKRLWAPPRRPGDRIGEDGRANSESGANRNQAWPLARSTYRAQCNGELELARVHHAPGRVPNGKVEHDFARSLLPCRPKANASR